jgi:hypothetical protein
MLAVICGPSLLISVTCPEANDQDLRNIKTGERRARPVSLRMKGRPKRAGAKKLVRIVLQVLVTTGRKQISRLRHQLALGSGRLTRMQHHRTKLQNGRFD